MYNRYRLRLVIAIALAMIAAFMLYGYMDKLQQKEMVVVAKKNIDPYTKITPDMVTMQSINIEARSMYFPFAVSDVGEIIGAISRIEFKANQPIEKTPEKLVYDEEKTLALNYQGNVDVAYFIPYEKRVMGVEVDASGSLSFKLKKGDFVDVIYTSIDDSTGGMYSTMILQHIQVFDIEELKEQNLESGISGKKQNILLLAKPDDCIKLSAAKRNGQIDLILNPLNGQTDSIEPINVMEFAADRPMPKSEMLSILEENIKVENITEGTKKQLLEVIDKERNVETIINLIEASKLSKEEKSKLIEQLNK